MQTFVSNLMIGGSSEEEIICRTNKGRKLIKCLSYVVCGKFRKHTKKRLYKRIIHNTIIFGVEVCEIKASRRRTIIQELIILAEAL